MAEVITHTKEFYESLASIFYSMVVVDNNVNKNEKLRIKALVDEHWSNDNKIKNSEEIIFNKLNQLFTGNYDKESAFFDFKRYFINHPEEFNDELKFQILKDVDSISMAFSRRNKSESILNSQLYFLLFKSHGLFDSDITN
ncbi:hypothetical protein [Marivirga arenosa]|uniref:TerB family tellurite resistance protein n=1 Tax=Marivirga arenosa TaxID=3059076 RepID=A0AA51ZSX9_9BACT|nr:hypothetical protein [Marivirga sp. BKB1-2]WNB16931.1 hypothetical protein QYS47_32320 [Marivirga sp. BKB1-2]